jgi:SpoVK/Ycf46/Vps4 family AAA+-type ATPase
MTKVFGGVGGNPEFTMQRALRTVEAIAPVILWIDEIENGLAGSREGDGGVTNRIFSSFLTWMQERKEMVFIAATANQIAQLPAEFLRKGRFDEIFFVDLPTESERLDIFRVHLQRRGHDPEKFSLLNLAKGTNNFNGAEIENCVVAGLFTAFNEKRPLHDSDLYKSIGETVPLATTMAETIKSIKRWADTRAVKAS